VLAYPNSLYAQWRLEPGAAPFLHEEGESPPERLLQAVWQHQRLRRDQLETTDGASLRVLHPGFINREGGPDFRDAVLQVGDGPTRSGDIEVDVQAGGWRAHGYDRNPAFARVILHVIWEREPPGAGLRPAAPSIRPASTPPATLVLRDVLDASVAELGLWLNRETDDGLPEAFRGQCAPAWGELSAAAQSRLLREASQIRFQSRTEQLQARARQAGWEQALWEGLFRALGYKHNAWPMQCLAEQRQRWLTPPLSALDLQARLLGLGGLLPTELTRSQASADGYLRRVWDSWWRERAEYQACALPLSVWRFHGQRPANSPQRRLALVAHWLTRGDLVSRIERWCATPLPDRELTASLMNLLRIEDDDFWCFHWTIRSRRLKKAQPLLGTARVTDLAVNVILPWLWIRAREGGNTELQRSIEHRFEIWPPADDNAVLRLARQRLLGGAPRRALRTAAEQQGILQIVRDFCGPSDAVCRGCRFPRLVRDWQRRWTPSSPG
jgi:hypothetical protein